MTDTWKILEDEARRKANDAPLTQEQLAIVDLLHLTKMMDAKVRHLLVQISDAKTEIVTLQALIRSLQQTAEKVAHLQLSRP